MRPGLLDALRRLDVDAEALSSVLEDAPFGVLIDHPEDGCIYANDFVLEMFDLSWEALRGFGWMGAILPEDIETLRATFERYQQTKADVEVRYRIKAGDGSTRAVTSFARPILDAQGEQLGSIIVGRSTTEERAESERTVNAQKLEVIGRLAGRVAHDFNNILTPIICSASLLEREVASPEAKESLATIVQGVEHAAALTRQLLGLSRQGTVGARSAVVDNEIRALRSMIDQLVGERIELEVDLDATGAAVALAPHELGQILLNLCVNGRDAVGGEGKVRVGTERDGSLVRLSVSDTGVGIPVDVQHRMFEPFFTTKPPDRGTGLGLSTVFDLVRRAGGDITVRSELGSGTRMTVELPVVFCRSPEQSESSSHREVPPQRILLVDDNAALRQTLAYVLAMRKHEVTTAGSCARALELVAEREFDVLITDILLPDGRGDVLAAEARKESGVRRIVYISGFAGEEFELEAPHRDYAVFLQKPFHPNRVVDAIGELLDADATSRSA